MNKFLEQIGKDIKITGWVKKNRRLGDLIFVDLRNIKGIIQIVFEAGNINFEAANHLRNEDVIEIHGKIVKRKNINKILPTGTIEIIAKELIVISKAKQTPLIIDDKTDALEPIRMEYRYLDLRRPLNQKMLIFRSEFNRIVRNYFYDLDFKEIETPLITRTTPGGADELKVISANHPGKEFSLVQSPQIYKQLLMYSGIDKYFQIAKCFRDEDSRADRQLEFTQLDLEMNFTSEKEIIVIIENLIKKLWKKLISVDLITPFPVISYDEALEKYGTDKPDLRIKEIIYDFSKILEKSELTFISSPIKNNSETAKGLAFDGELSSSIIKKEVEIIKSEGGKGLAWARVENGKVIKGTLKKLSQTEVLDIIQLVRKDTFTLFLIIDEPKNALELIGRLTNRIAHKLNLIPSNTFEFIWVNDWPLFELNSDNKIDAVHNPFTSISLDDLETFKAIDSEFPDIDTLIKLKARGYDLVLNGSEIGGGAIRISDKEIQHKVFTLLGISEKEIESNFGWFLKAQDFGIPNHGGIALGIDRILSIILNKDSIRDVIAFPKSTKGTDEMSKAPTMITKK